MADLRQGTCPKCDHRRTLHITQIADGLGDIGGSNMAVQMSPAEDGQFLPWRIARVPKPREGLFFTTMGVQAVGLVEAFLCAACGFTELYTRDPARIPVDGTIVKEIHGPKAEGPFR